jgi:acetate kinase
LARCKVLVAHLGYGASITAIADGKSMACSLGFSTLSGLPMATRCGDLDPGILLYLQTQGWTASQITDLIYNRSGLLALSEESADLRALLESPAQEACFAVEYFCYRAARTAASLVCALQGADALIFTGGIGMHQPLIRERICQQLNWMGVRLDEAANAIGQPDISHPESRLRVLIIPPDEESEICRQARVFWPL